MNDVSLWQNEIQFPVKNIWDSLNIFYISDIHVEFHIEGFETIKKRSLPPAIRKLVIDIFGENKDRAKRGYFDYIIIDGDIADDIAIVDIFFSCLNKEIPSMEKVLYVLGNHELSAYSTRQECYEQYMKLSAKHGIHLLINDGFMKYDYIDKRSVPKCLIFGGTGFSKYNEMYNTTNLCYSKDLINNRDEEIKESEIFYSIYKKYLLKAKKLHLPLIVISHCPVNDWLKEGEEDSQCIYFYGHDHHNRYVRDKYRTIFADNQIGYTGNIQMKLCSLGCVYDPFIRYTDGCHKISIEEYVLYYRYIGERLNEPKLINNILKQKDAGLYLIKHDGYYGFFVKTQKGVKMCVGGMVKQVSTINSMDYYNETFLSMVKSFYEGLKPYRLVQERIASEVKRLGFNGTIHGCIVDVNYYNHIMVNPYDGKLTYYYSPVFGVAKQFASFDKLLESINKERLSEQITTAEQIEEQKKILGVLQKENALICQPQQNLSEYIDKMIFIDRKESLYAVSRRVNQVQRLFSANLLREWDNTLVASKIEFESNEISGYNLIEDNWKNILLLRREDVTEKMLRKIILGRNKRNLFPYISYENWGGKVFPLCRAKDEEIELFMSLVPDSMFKDRIIREQLMNKLDDDFLKYYPAKYFTYDLLQKYVKSCGELAIIKNAPYLARMKEQAHIRRYFIEIAEKNANYTIKHIDELPKEYQCEELYQKLALSLYQKHRPKWCPDYIWKYHNKPR